MEYMIIISLCVFLVVEVTAPPPLPQWPIRPKHKICNTAQDCEADQCCVKFGPSFFRKGRCMKLSSEGKRCSQEELARNGKYFGRCPCAEGLHCEANDVVETKFGKMRINGRCAKPGSSTVQPDEEITDSGSSESEET